MTQSRITVLMPVHNGERYLRPAVESILAQSRGDFEFLIIDDGSTDGSREICRSYKDSRIRLVENGRNLGLIASLNRGLDLAGGEFIARMDCDDVSFPDRFSRQVSFMESHPDIGICGTWYERSSDRGMARMRIPTGHGAIRLLLLFDNPFLHSTVLMRRSVLEKRGLRFDPGYRHAEDYEFWARCSEYTKLANLPEVLLRYRYHPENVTHRYRREQGAAADRVRCRQLEYLGVSVTEAEIELHNALAKFEYSAGYGDLERAKAWLEKLIALGCRRSGIPESTVYAYLAHYWYGACGKFAHEGLRTWRMFRSAPTGRAAEWEWQWKLLLRCVLKRDIVQPATDSPSALSGEFGSG